jgi:exopolysaccharide biosynthesis polyprenyl glycosylphosphotransferase
MGHGDGGTPAVPRQLRLHLDLAARTGPGPAVGTVHGEPDPVPASRAGTTDRALVRQATPSGAESGGGPDRARPVSRIRTGSARRRYPWSLLALDVLIVAAVSVFLIGTGSPAPPPMVAALTLLVVLALTRGYEDRFLSSGTEEFRRVFTAGVVLVAAVSTLALVTDNPSLRMTALVGAPSMVVGVLVTHGAARWIRTLWRRRGHCQQTVVVVGLERSVAELIRTTRKDPGAGLTIVAACVSGTAVPRVEGVPVLGGPADVLAVLEVAEADTVVLTAWSDVDPEELRRLTWDLEGSGVSVLVAPRLSEVAAPRLHLRTVGGLALLDVNEPEFTGVRRVAKTALDYALTVPGLLVIAPLLAVLAVLVKVSSPGPVFFRQVRIGRHGHPFVMHKFRTMYIDAEERMDELRHLNENGDGPLFKLRSDPRVTPVGGILRRYSLDELPQLFDVLLGRMSLVGPRPPLPSEAARYEQDTRRRLMVKPGITGLWQVSGRSDLSWQESVRLDLHYVENWFLGLDLSIIVRTLSAVLARRGAY